MMVQIRLPTRHVLQGDTGHRSRDVTQFGGRIWATKGRISKGFGQSLSLGLPQARPGDCTSLVVPVPSRKARLAKTLRNSGHMSQY